MKMPQIILVFLAILSLSSMKFESAASASRGTSTAPQEGKGCGAPKEWGPLKGVADRSVAFEDASGSIRVLDLGPCMRGQTQLIVKITRPDR
jgi:hypothetical protein